ncbi:MAG: peptidase C15 [Kamptonema sp. SIO4C4]|nr:peptidase C15 [Kamptonema sp. SIO4C4]
MKRLLLTSFQTWLPHQVSNASDDLLAMLVGRHFEGIEWVLLRQLPVETTTASEMAIAAIQDYNPDGIICCGMAETRYWLTVESHAKKGKHQLPTTVNLQELIASLSFTRISHDAGKFVCEGVYFEVLKHLQEHRLSLPCVFVHVPVITTHNQHKLYTDFIKLLHAI